MDGLQSDDRATVLRLITTTIHQHAKVHPPDLAAHIADDLKAAGYEIAKPGQPRQHTWPPNSSGGRAHCLVCGAAYGGTRAQGPCEPRE
jgi:hypothetical protein